MFPLNVVSDFIRFIELFAQKSYISIQFVSLAQRSNLDARVLCHAYSPNQSVGPLCVRVA